MKYTSSSILIVGDRWFVVLLLAACCFGAKRFPQLELLAKALITTISDLNQPQMLTIELSIASSQEHAKELLLSLVSAA